MEQVLRRLEKLESSSDKVAQQLTALERDLAVIKSNHATLEGVQKAINDQTWKLITWTTGLGAALVGASFLIARYVH